MSERGAIMKVLTSGTPLSLDLVTEGWTYLSTEEKRTILNTKYRYRRHLGVVLDVALNDPNPVVRWMASNLVHEPSEHTHDEVRAEEQSRWTKVQNDPIAFVRKPWSEIQWGGFLGLRKDADVFEWFWSLPRYERLVQVHGMTDGEFVSGAVQYLLDKNCVGERIRLSEVLDVLIQFFTWRDYQSNIEKGLEYDDWACENHHWRDCRALWELVARAKAWPWIVETLLEFLPSEGSTLEILEALEPNQLTDLLYRQNFDTNGSFRKSFFKSGEIDIKRASLCCKAFSFTDQDFEAFFLDVSESPDVRKEKIINIRLLAESYTGGNLAQLIAIAEQASKTRDEYLEITQSHDYDPVNRPFAEQRVKQLPYAKLARESVDLRIFTLAEGLSEGRNHLLEGYGHFEKNFMELAVKGMPWKTYLNLKSKISSSVLPSIIDRLPSIETFRVEGIPDYLAKNIDDRPHTLAAITPYGAEMANMPPGQQELVSMLNGEFAAIQDISSRLNIRIDSLNNSIISIEKMLSIFMVFVVVSLMMLLARGCR